jgi:hypothetical protein
MASPPRYSTSHDTHDEFFLGEELFPGERIGQPRSRAGGKAMLWGVAILIALGGGWALLGGQAAWPAWLPTDIAAMLPSMDRKVSRPVEPAASAMSATVPLANAEPTKPIALDALPSSKAGATPDATARSAAPPLTTGALPPAATGEASDQPLRPPTADPADPYQVRAEAVGLHPDLSRVLLARLSPADYRNAGIAIQTAVKETPDSAVFVWPRQRKPELAHFQVKFVPGAAPGCRRYVVTVTKDGWSTTALPMEKCGVQAIKTSSPSAKVR